MLFLRTTNPGAGNQTVKFGAKTLAGAGGRKAPAGATITGGTATGYDVVNGLVTPSSNGSADAGTITFSDGTTWTMDVSSDDLANTYEVRTEEEYNAWVALEDEGTVARFPVGGMGFCRNTITWRINKTLKYGLQYGRFILGDFWAAGAFNIVAKTPAWDGTRHGDMLNIAASANQGFYDGSAVPYASGSRQTYPVSIDGNSVQSFVMSEGRDTQASGGAAQVLARAEVFTCVRESDVASIGANTFRPAYCGTKRFLSWDDAVTSILPDLTKPASATMPTTGQMKYVWLHYPQSGVNTQGANTGMAQLHPDQNMEPYPGDSSLVVSDYAAAVILDHANRDTYAKELTQVGIDHFGVHKSGVENVFSANAGFGNGWKFPIMFAALILDDSTMQAYDQTTTNLWNGAVQRFGEDGHTYYGDDEQSPGTQRAMWGVDGTNIGYSEPPYSRNHDRRDYATPKQSEVNAPPGYSDPGILYYSNKTGDFAVGETVTDGTTSATAEIVSINDNGDGTGELKVRAIYNGPGPTVYGFDVGDAITGNVEGAAEVAVEDFHGGAYRTAVTSYTWPGQKIAAEKITGMETLWNHPPFFDYVDRWIADNYDPGGKNIYGSTFVQQVWADHA